MANLREKFAQLIRGKKSKKLAEGFGPIYDKSGKILPKYRNLGPEYEKDIKLKVMKKRVKPKKKEQPHITNIKHLA